MKIGNEKREVENVLLVKLFFQRKLFSQGFLPKVKKVVRR